MGPILKEVTTPVANSLIKIASVDIPGGVDIMSVAIGVANVANINAFQVRAKVLDRIVTIASISADYTSPKGPVLGASGDLTALAANAQGWLLLSVKGFSAIELWASCAAAGPTDVEAEFFGR